MTQHTTHLTITTTYQPTCTCGWVGTRRNSRGTALMSAQAHVDAADLALTDVGGAVSTAPLGEGYTMPGSQNRKK